MDTLAVDVQDLFSLLGVILRIIIIKNNEDCFVCKSYNAEITF